MFAVTVALSSMTVPPRRARRARPGSPRRRQCWGTASSVPRLVARVAGIGLARGGSRAEDEAVAELVERSRDAAGGRPDHRGAADEAGAPGQLSARSWRQVLRRAAGHLVAERLPLLSAGIAFFAVLSIAPVLVTALSVYGAVNTPAQALDQLSRVADMLPDDLRPIVADQLTSITTASTQVQPVRGLSALVIALWTATTAMSCLIDALTLAYHETETRGFLRRTLLAFGFVLGGALLLGALLTAARLVSQALDGAPGAVGAVAPAVIWLALGALMSGVIAVLYRFGPDRKQARWRWITWGATGATVLWVATSIGLFAYVQSIGTYESTYGSLAG